MVFCGGGSSSSILTMSSSSLSLGGKQPYRVMTGYVIESTQGPRFLKAVVRLGNPTMVLSSMAPIGSGRVGGTNF